MAAMTNSGCTWCGTPALCETDGCKQTRNATPTNHAETAGSLPDSTAETVGDDRQSMGSEPAMGIVTGGSDPTPLSGLEIQAEAFRMFESWRNIYASDYEGDILELAVLYMDAPPEEHATAARVAGIKPPYPLSSQDRGSPNA